MSRSLAVVLACGLWVSVPVILAVGCGDDSGDDEHGDHGDHDGDTDEGTAPHDHDADIGPPSGATCPEDSTLTYGNFAKPFFTKYCNRCHSASVKGAARMSAPADHNFDTVEEIELLAKHIDEYAAAGPSSTNVMMPPTDPKPTTDERKKLGEWLECGVPE